MVIVLVVVALVIVVLSVMVLSVVVLGAVMLGAGGCGGCGLWWWGLLFTIPLSYLACITICTGITVSILVTEACKGHKSRLVTHPRTVTGRCIGR